MKLKIAVLFLSLGLIVVPSLLAQPSGWAVFVPTRDAYTGSGSADFYSYYVNHNFWCSLWTLTGIDHLTWTCSGAGNPGFLDPAIPP